MKNLKYIIIISISCFFYIITFAIAGQWNDKPIMCEQKDIALKIIKDKKQIALASGISSTKVRDGQKLRKDPVLIPIQIFVNLKTKTYTIAEYHPLYNSICILAYGNDFNQIGAKL